MSAAFGLVTVAAISPQSHSLFTSKDTAHKGRWVSHWRVTGKKWLFYDFSWKHGELILHQRKGSLCYLANRCSSVFSPPSLKIHLCRTLSTKQKNCFLTPLGFSNIESLHWSVFLWLVLFLLSKNGMCGLTANLRTLSHFSEHSTAMVTCKYCSQKPLWSSHGEVYWQCDFLIQL